MEKAPPLVLLGGADAHDLVLVEMLIDDYPNIIFVVLTSLNPIIPLRPRETLKPQGLTVVRNYKSCGWGRERCDREGHAVFCVQG